MVPKTGSRRSDGLISRFLFCGENVRRSLVVCSHDPFFRTNKESSIWRQNDHEKISVPFHLSRRVSAENRACFIFIRFLKITDPFDGRSFLMCSHDPFFGTNKNRILKNGSCERAFTAICSQTTFNHQVLRLRPLENTLSSGQPSTLMLTDIKTGNIPLKNSERFLIKLSKHYGYRPGRF